MASSMRARRIRPDFRCTLPWPGEDEWEQDVRLSAQERWLPCSSTLPWFHSASNMIGRDQGFSQFLVGNNWLKVLATVPEDPAALLRVLDQYLNQFIENTQYFQMRHRCLHAVANNLETFLLSLAMRRAVQQLRRAFHRVSSKANFAFDGTGIDAPPLTGINRSVPTVERMSGLEDSPTRIGYRFAFTPIRKVRRLCTQLFGTPEGFTAIQSSEIFSTDLMNCPVVLA